MEATEEVMEMTPNACGEPGHDYIHHYSKVPNASEAEQWRAVADQLAAAARLVLMRAKEQPGPFKQLIDGGSLQEALNAYNAVPNAEIRGGEAVPLD